MKKSTILQKVVVAALTLFLCPAVNAQYALVPYTIDSGGGESSGGEFTLKGTFGQHDASTVHTGGTFSLSGGFWNQINTPGTGGYAAWAAINIAAGQDAAFDGDANLDGIANGIAYVFGSEAVQVISQGSLTAPPTDLPSDVILILESSPDLNTWTPVLEYVGGVQTMISNTLSIADGTITDSAGDDEKFYKYRVQLIQ